MKLTIRERFLAKVCPDRESGCWLWRGMVIASGYGMVRFERKMYMAHRLAWKLFRGEIAPGLVVCHKCDVRACVNPEHLFVGTMMDNMRDMKQKGRNPHGDKHSRSKLTAEKVSRIKRMLAEDRMNMSEIAREYGVTPATIGCIARGTSWRHVEAAPVVIGNETADEEVCSVNE
ncbi:MAG TPA: HNH endonuclease [Candidatus Angelobacter sp.]|nr:HNH endonuclease [Candidatus Angelobacter sp.]